jgi:hypothetical protein
MNSAAKRKRDAAPDQGCAHEADELKKLISKLRWIGMDQEAETMCARLSRISPQDISLVGPLDTD